MEYDAAGRLQKRTDPNGVELTYTTFLHPTYDQGGREFQAGLGIVDSLSWCGSERVRGFLQTRS